MICPSCRREVLEDARFCSWCGRDLIAPETIAAEPLPAGAPPVTTQIVQVERVRPHPWLRYFARSLDFTLVLLIFLLVVGTARIRIQDGLEYIIGFSAYLVLFVAEILLLAGTGTTVGKSLFRISVASKSGGRPTLAQAAKRSFGVFLRGLAFGVPILTMVAQALGYVNLIRFGETSWDRDSDTEVHHGEISGARAAVIAVVFFVLVLAAVIVLLASTQPRGGDTTV